MCFFARLVAAARPHPLEKGSGLFNLASRVSARKYTKNGFMIFDLNLSRSLTLSPSIAALPGFWLFIARSCLFVV